MKIPKTGKCVECGTMIIDEFPELNYVGCSGCSRIYGRED